MEVAANNVIFLVNCALDLLIMNVLSARATMCSKPQILANNNVKVDNFLKLGQILANNAKLNVQYVLAPLLSSVLDVIKDIIYRINLVLILALQGIMGIQLLALVNNAHKIVANVSIVDKEIALFAR